MGRLRVILDDRKLRKLEKRLTKLSLKKVRVGVVSGETHPSGISMAELAAIHEFGAPGANIPERSFIRSAFRESRTEQIHLITKLAKQVVAGTMTNAQALNLIGLWNVSKIKQKIKDGISPANKPSTIAKKGSSLPLVDTGRLINAITHKVD